MEESIFALNFSFWKGVHFSDFEVAFKAPHKLQNIPTEFTQGNICTIVFLVTKFDIFFLWLQTIFLCMRDSQKAPC